MLRVCRSSAIRRLSVIVGVVIVLLVAAPRAAAQAQSDSRWGVQVSFTPSWKGNDSLSSGLQWAPEGIRHEGSDVLVGVLRGSSRGGDWGVSYVRKTIKDSTITDTQTNTFCPNPTTCVVAVDEFTEDIRNVKVDGVEVHFFVPFVRFADRVQLGANVGGGVGFSSGSVTSTQRLTTTTTTTGQPPRVDTTVFTDVEDAAGDVIGETVVLVKAEVHAAILVAPGLKIRVAAGLNAPSVAAFRVGVSYLFGAR